MQKHIKEIKYESIKTLEPISFKYKKDENDKEEEYKLNKIIRKDNFIKFYLYENNKKEIIACKLMSKSYGGYQFLFRDSLEGIIIQNSINRPDIVKIIDYSENDAYVFLFLEYCKNKSLENLINKRKFLSEKEVYCCMVQLIITLNYLHSEQIIHGELTTKNIFFGDNMELKLSDFLLAKRLSKERKKLKEIKGVPIYMAPEIVKKEPYSFEIDIWSLGIIMYKLLTGENPFFHKDRDKLFEIIKNSEVNFPSDCKISPAAKDLVKQILVKDPSKRLALNQIIYHDFFNREGVPKYLSLESFEKAPEDFPENILNKEVETNKLNTLIKPKIEPIIYDKIKSLNEIKYDNIKSIDKEFYIIKYYDYYKRYGVGYLLNNGCVGVFFRDKTKMVLTKNNVLKYIGKEEEEKTFEMDTIPKDLETDGLINKVNILKEFIKCFESKDNNAENIDNENKANENKVNEDKDNENNYIYAQNVILDEKLIFFKLSSQTQQVFYKDKIEMIMTYDTLYYNKSIVKIMLKDVLSNPIRELKARFNYARYVYINWINEKISKKLENIRKSKK